MRKNFIHCADREKVPCAVIGDITGDGYIVLHDENDGSTPVNLDLSKVLGEMPRKTFTMQRIQPKLEPLALPDSFDSAGRPRQGAPSRLCRFKKIPYE